MSHSMTRRAAVAGAAAIASAAPILAAASVNATGADAELIELGRQLQAAMVKEEKAEAHWRPLRAAFDLQLSQSLGLPDDRKEWTDEELTAFSDAFTASQKTRPGRLHDAAYDAWNAANVPCYKLVDEIRKLPAQTIGGLGAKAIAVCFVSGSNGAWDEAGKEVADLIESVASVAGVGLPPREPREEIADDDA